MDISSLSISLPVVVSLVGCFIGVMTYLGNKKKQSKEDTAKEKEAEARLVSMEKDIQYIRVMVDKIDEKYENHETRISKLEVECNKRKGQFMDIKTIITLIILGIVVVSGILAIIVAIVRGDMKKFIEEKMIEAEQQEMSGAKKLEYVLLAVKDKYKIFELFLNVKKFIEHIIAITKKINVKQEEILC